MRIVLFSSNLVVYVGEELSDLLIVRLLYPYIVYKCVKTNEAFVKAHVTNWQHVK